MDMNFRDSKNRYHRVCVQAYNTSCGPACIAMVERIYKHLAQSDEARARQISQKYPGKWTEAGGSWPANWSAVLNAVGVRTYAATGVGYAAVYTYLKHYARFATPVLAGVRWYSGGGHAVLCAIHDTDDKFVFYDPWYGIVEVAGSRFPYYEPPNASGYLDGWLVITRE